MTEQQIKDALLQAFLDHESAEKRIEALKNALTAIQSTKPAPAPVVESNG